MSVYYINENINYITIVDEKIILERMFLNMRKQRNKLLARRLKYVNTEDDLLNFYQNILDHILKYHYYRSDKNKSVIYLDDMIFIKSHLIETNKESLSENENIKDKVQEIVFFIFT